MKLINGLIAAARSWSVEIGELDREGIMLGTLLADMSIVRWKKFCLSEEEYKGNILWEVELPSRRAS